MTDTTWAAKVLEGVPRYVLNMLAINMDKNPHGAWVKLPDVEAAIARMGREMALDVLASSGQAQEAYAAQLAAEAERDYTHGTNEVLRAENQRIEAERDALRAKVARLEGAVMWARDRIAVDSGMTKAETKRTADELLNVLRGKPSPASDYAPETWQSPTRAALTDGGKDG